MTNTPHRTVSSFLFIAALFCLASCGGSDKNESNDQTGSHVNVKTAPDDSYKSSKSHAGKTLHIYSGRKESLVGELFESFEDESGIELEVTYGKTGELATRLSAEGDLAKADVFFAQDSGYLGALANAGAFLPLSEKILKQVDERFRDKKGRWVGTSGRARVLVYNPELIDKAALPKSLKELSSSHYKGQVGWAPSNSSAQAHMSALINTWGKEATKSWLQAMVDNESVVYPKNTPIVQAVDDGEVKLGWVNHYYLHKLRAVGNVDDALNANFSISEDAGNILMVSGAGVSKNTDEREAAEHLLAYLVSKSAQEYFTSKTWEYATRPGVHTHSDVPKLEEIGLASIEQETLVDIPAVLELLQELGLQ